jgi:glycosyltransferase involved in cell wall biosynthesis
MTHVAMTHIAMVIPTLDRLGGAERQLIALARGLRERGWTVTVVALAGNGGDARRELEAADARFVSLKMRKGLADPRGWIGFYRWLRAEQPEIVHAHLPHAAWLARWSRLAAPVRVLVDTVHTASTGTRGRRLGYRLSRWLPDCTTTVGLAVGCAYLEAGMILEQRSAVIANGVDMDYWRPDASARTAIRSELGLRDEFLWFAAGRLEPVKDYPTMLRAFAQAGANGRLAIAGAGPLEAELRGLAAELNIGNRVQFLGFQPNVRRWMRAADGFVQSSLWEGLPMGLIEAAACGLPAVATDVAGTREIIVSGETGWLAPAGSAEELASRMRLAKGMTENQRKAMGEWARASVVERYSLTSVLDKWEALYSELLALSPRPRRRAASRSTTSWSLSASASTSKALRSLPGAKAKD